MSSATIQRGGDQSGMRTYNRRMILDLIRQNGAMPKAEMARAVGLSAQTVSVIVNELLKDRLVKKEAKVRGYVGQPYTPIALNPDGVLSIGIKIGRRTLETMLVNFLGETVAFAMTPYEAPRRQEVLRLVETAIADLFAGVSDRQRDRIVGIGVAMPGQIGDWTEEVGLHPGDLDDWAGYDVAEAIGALSGLPVEVFNDMTAACAAEMHAGTALTKPSALYVYLGSFIGGGVVINGRLYRGEQGNAGAIGSMPVFAGNGRHRPNQLIRDASLITLQRAVQGAGLDGHSTIADVAADPRAGDLFESWLGPAADAIAQAIACAISVIDFQTVVIDGPLHRAQVETIVRRVTDSLSRLDRRGLSPVEIVPGTVGARARVLGAAVLPIIRQFSPDQELLLKQLDQQPGRPAFSFSRPTRDNHAGSDPQRPRP